MAGDANRIVVAQIARLWLAPVGTAAPAGPTVAMPAGWKDVGLFTPDSLSVGTEVQFTDVNSHQSLYPTRTFQTGESATVSVDLQEWSKESFVAVYGGGTIAAVGTGGTAYYTFTPPAVGSRATVAACIELGDGAKHYRRLIPRCNQREGVTQTYNRSSEATLPLRLTILGNADLPPFIDMTDDPAFDPAAI